ncbi:uncharacterized protein LOC108738850 [Agrilus planipennis]|uniref:Uncharacterized protein LOC108738850 n=1 Tax=Agrilus planipennis TaxID=224129 RepID=A0A1W4WVP2_AGRPL|nr:uncharacterized protein LOC108738850 [Agrilus planipennis]
MAKLDTSLYAVLFLIVVTLNFNPCFGGSSQLRCYYCDASILSACDDPPVKAVLPSVECREPPAHVVSRDGQSVTDFVLSRSRDGQFNGVTLVTNILLREIPREAELTDQEYTFYCGKITLKSGMYAFVTVCAIKNGRRVEKSRERNYLQNPSEYVPENVSNFMNILHLLL